MLSNKFIYAALGILTTLAGCSPQLSTRNIPNHERLYNEITANILDRVGAFRCFNDHIIDMSSINVDYVVFDSVLLKRKDYPISIRRNLINTSTGEVNDTTGNIGYIMASEHYPQYIYDNIYFQYPDIATYEEKVGYPPTLNHSPIYQQDSSLLIISKISGIEFNLEAYIESEFKLCPDGSYTLTSIRDNVGCIEITRSHFESCKSNK